MRDRSYDIATDFLASFFRDVTEHAVELRSLTNDRSGPPKPLFTRDPEMIEAHCRRFDVPDRGMYFGVCTRLLGASQGRRADLAECRALWSDIDCLKDGIDKAEAIAAVKSLPIPPSVIIDSGGGLHLYWLLIEAIDIRAGEDDAEEHVTAALRQIADVVAGDPVVCELARVMRVPGTMNGKREGEPAIVSIVEASWKSYDFDEIVSWLDWQRPILRAPSTQTEAPTNPFLAASLRAGFKPPIDVERALEAMSYGGIGDTSIHQTQLRVSAALAHAGRPEDEIVAMLLDATRAAAGEHAKAWNWRREEQSIRAMTVGAKAKFGVREAAVVHNLAEERAERAKANGTTGGAMPPPPSKAKAKIHQIAEIGNAAIEDWRSRVGPIISVAGELATYANGVWTVFGEEQKHLLRVTIQGVTEAQGVDPRTSTLNAALRYVEERPELLRAGVEWNAANLIVCRNGVIDPVTGKAGPHSLDHWATYRIEANIDPQQECPTWLAFLDGCLSNLNADERRDVIATLQEWFGAALVRHKPREMTKALIAFGPSRSGKTQLAQVMRALVGGRPSGMRARDLEDRFGMQALIGASAWIADDAVSSGDYLDAERFKIIVTGEPTSIQRKNLTNIEVALDIPVLLTSNHLPRVKDQSEAVYNRSLLLPMTVVREESLGGGRPISETIIKNELGGVLNWAIAGWRRLQMREYFDPPRVMRKALEDYRGDNNPVATWLAAAVTAEQWFMVDRRDLAASFNGWFVDEFGPDSKIPGGRWLFPSIRQAMPSIADHKIMGERFVVGLKLTDEGLSFLERAQALGFGKAVGSGAPKAQVNRMAPSGPPVPTGKQPRF